MSETRPGPLSVFISSTEEDLRPYRAAARDAAISAGFLPVMMEYFPASGGHPPLEACLRLVSAANVLVVLVAYRYGWKPLKGKSITWLECERAASEDKEVLAFFVDKSLDWPEAGREEYRIMTAIREGRATPELLAEVQQDVAKLAEFKQWLNDLGIRPTFTTPEDLRGKVDVALREWRVSHGVSGSPSRPNDPRLYLEYLREQTAWIDIRGLQVGTGKAHRFPIEDLYIPLTTMQAAGAKRFELEDALTHRRLVIVGEPGAGKTTFLRRVAFALCSASLSEAMGAYAAYPTGAVEAGTGFLSRVMAVFGRTRHRGQSAQIHAAGEDRPFPIFIRVADLAEHIHKCRLQPGRPGPATRESPAWVVDFLNTQNEELNWGLSETFFREKLEGGACVLLLDGLDEAPGRLARESIARLFEKATHAYRDCRFVVTTRPLSYAGESLLDGFQTAHIEPLEAEALEKFLQHWCRALFPASDSAAQGHLGELSEALRARAEIRRMARNPVMLTALAVVHWNERRLPEQRADLYESILNWLARTREKRPGREPAERCLMLLHHLALTMLNDPAARQVQVSKGWAAERLAAQFAGDFH